ncbi:MAG TPA: SgcJ/EcaC family oxidoreductase [Blastococcus sp.]
MTAAHPNDAKIRSLYASFIDGWNRRSGASVAAGFADDGDIIGFDGTHHRGRLSIAADLRQIFGSHETPAYVALIRSVRPMAPGVAVLLAHAGMIPAGGNDLDPDLHTVHTMVAVDEGGGRWRISLFQSTPAAWHDRPEARDALTDELRGVLATS